MVYYAEESKLADTEEDEEMLVATATQRLGSKASLPREDPPKNKGQKNVSFGSIVIRQYSVSLGDNPTCSYGFPVQLDWRYKEVGTISVDEYEDAIGPRRRRSMRQLVLSSHDRRDMLKAAGYSLTEMQQAQRSVNIAKRQRAASLVTSPASQVTVALQGAVKRIFKRKRRGI